MRFPPCVLGAWILLLPALSAAGAGEGAVGAFDLGLLTPAALSAERERWVVLDGRSRRAYEAGHIPGARPFSWEDHTGTDPSGVPYRMWPPGRMAGALARVGIGPDTPVAAYGDAGRSWGGEAWICWVLAYLGHRGPIRLLAGGIQAWRRAGLPLERGPAPPPRPGPGYTVALRPDVLADRAAAARAAREGRLVDVRSTWEWWTGRIPGAVHVPWTDFREGDPPVPISAGRFRAVLARVGVPADGPVVFYCAGGVRSAWAWLAAVLAGRAGARNYEGGMAEWRQAAR
ncbi:hypothetical protein G3N55_04735 [Dissulfurirhabdus thermomarina]|uniref:Rhodanese domain-containing protein n=1 Tax=Dissulfurirhabdus thermomarina TaxID=1765737 RepID=A0A6N9TLJ6_DISTH|nr:rhodanese-like domain-containing protein [Dissulfurirhabdus thermomarina]NDY42151.1 hypothetical protein [Dissulfurirhabdus thermomarina]NMX23085.1 hypothetical protein [Dissulfurirhabdus thermomarina]